MRILKYPKVYLIARPQIVEEGLQQFLTDNDLRWPTPSNGVASADRLVEIAGRNCYMSYGNKAGSKTNERYVHNLIGKNSDGTWKDGPAHGSVCEHPCWSFLITGAGRGFCYDDQTEVLTSVGWKKWQDVDGSEEFATLSLADELQYQKATAICKESYKGKMYKVSTKRLDLCVTPSHRMLYKPYKAWVKDSDDNPWLTATAEDIAGTKYRCKRDAKWVGENPAEVTIPDFITHQYIYDLKRVTPVVVRHIQCKGHRFDAKAFAAFLGYYLAEGSLDHQSKGGYFVNLSQNPGTVVSNKMKKCVESLGLTYSLHKTGLSCQTIRINGGRSLYEWLKPLGKSHEKYIPHKFKLWSPQLLRILIDCYLAGDGSFTKRGSGEAHTASKQLADDLQEIALKAGWSATNRYHDRRDQTHQLNGKTIKWNHISYVVSISKYQHSSLVNRYKKQDCFVDYEGMIYCVTVPNGTLYVRRNGKPIWSHNSHEQVRHRTGWAYSQLSTRYCDFEREEEEGTWSPGFCLPPQAQLTDRTSELMTEQLKDSQRKYVELLHSIEDDLVSNEDYMRRLSELVPDQRERQRFLRKAARGAARDILPIATEAIMVMSANARAIWNCIVLRANEHAEGVIRLVYVQLARIMEKEMPTLFSGIRYGVAWDGLETVTMPRDKI